MGKVLVVDDAAFMRMRCVKLVTEAGHQAIEAENGQVAIAKYKEERPDLVFMDITMPVMDGIAAVTAITEFDPTANVVMVSALGQQSMVMAAMKGGAKDFIVKPYEPARMVAILQQFLG